ncbi:hypothetical protein [Dyadobacter sp. 676]|uniref:Uncharacterized protein n=1 Tax=Dyadobacter sp. 676 TaxID=3088362 RepID=A0AAU8FFW1_9BACT
MAVIKILNANLLVKKNALTSPTHLQKSSLYSLTTICVLNGKKQIQFQLKMPHTRGIGNPSDMALRYLDKVVIENALLLAGLQQPDIIYDTVRAPFQEGFPVYPDSVFREHDHIHLCVRNPDFVIETGESSPWGRVQYDDNLIKGEAPAVDELQSKMRKLLLDFS